MRWACRLGQHRFDRECQPCVRCGADNPEGHVWRIDGDPAVHSCQRCGQARTTLEIWTTCDCHRCANMRETDAATNLSLLRMASGSTYRKDRTSGGVWRYNGDPSEGPMALDGLRWNLETNPEAVSDETLEEISQLAFVYINVQVLCNEAPDRQDLDCSRVVQAARQELVQRHGESILDELRPPTGPGAKAWNYGRCIARLVPAPDVSLPTSWFDAGAFADAGDEDKSDDGPSGPPVRRRVCALASLPATLAITGNGDALYLLDKAGKTLTKIGFDSGQRTEIELPRKIEYISVLGDGLIRMTTPLTRNGQYLLCHGTTVLDEAIDVSRGCSPCIANAAFVDEGGKPVLVGRSGPIAALEFPDARSFISCSHSAPHWLLIQHAPHDERSPIHWLDSPTWHELVQLSDDLSEISSRVVLRSVDLSADLTYNWFTPTGEDAFAFLVGPPYRYDEPGRLRSLWRYEISSDTSECVLEETRKITHLRALGRDRLIWFSHPEDGGPTIVTFDFTTRDRREVFTFPEPIRDADISADGKRVAYISTGGNAFELETIRFG